ncbi:translation protein SH3-like domain-containing protein [Peziza echinospora]|nr:translation protein SH3-like domain-containing protein [Peziza echinospora]
MSLAAASIRGCLRRAPTGTFLRPALLPTTTQQQQQQRRTIALEARDVQRTRRATPSSFHGNLAPHHPPKKIPVLPPPCAAPPKRAIELLTAHNIRTLDPTGGRSKQISRVSKDSIRPGDILQIRFRNRDPFSGVLINLRRRGIDSALLLRNQLTRIGVEMWVKVYSPLIAGVDVVQRSAKRARRARLYHMRKPKHDIGSVQNIVTAYMRQRALLRSGAVKKPGAPGGGKRR